MFLVGRAGASAALPLRAVAASGAEPRPHAQPAPPLAPVSLLPGRRPAQVKTRWLPPWHVLAGTALLLASLLHYLSGPTGVHGLEYLEYVSLGAVALCLPRIALRALLALRRLVSARRRWAGRRGCVALMSRPCPFASSTPATVSPFR